jgi:putative redox protein
VRSTAQVKLETVAGEGLRFAATTGPHTFRMDSGPEAAHASPVQAVLAALGGCAGMDVIAMLRKMRQAVTGYEIELVAERSEDHPRVFTAIEVVHRVYGENLNPASIAHAIELSDTKYCSVHAMLTPNVKLSSRFEILPPRPPA